MEFTKEELLLAEMNMLGTLNQLMFIINRERIYRQFLMSQDTQPTDSTSDMSIRDAKINTLQGALEVCRCILNISTNEVYLKCMGTFKNYLNDFMDKFTNLSDHSITVTTSSENTTETLPDQQAYLQICNEMKALYDTFTADENLAIMTSPIWKEIRSTRGIEKFT